MLPASEWWIFGVPSSSARSKTPITRRVSFVNESSQPRIRLVYASVTRARWAQREATLTHLVSETQNWWGESAAGPFVRSGIAGDAS